MSVTATATRNSFEAWARKYPRKAAGTLGWLECQPQAATSEIVQAKIAGLQAGLDAEVRCRRCGRKLTDPESVARKIGPECVKREAA